MSGNQKYLLVSLPRTITLGNDQDEALEHIRGNVGNFGTVYQFSVPTFKIGTVDALIQQADELAKLNADCEAVVSKTSESLSSILEGDKEKIEQQKNVNDKPVEQYLKSFSWNKVKYRAEKPIGELIEALKKELAGVDNDVKSKFGEYNTTKNNLQQAQKKQTGNLATRSLTAVVDPKILIKDSEYLETHLIAVPKAQSKEFYKNYETLCPMVVPRSCMEVDKDSEFILFAVTTFKKYSHEFVHKAREHRWTPRDFRYQEGGREEEEKEVKDLENKANKLWGEALRLGRTGYSEGVMTWMHVLALRVFIESVLRYGLPAEFASALVQTNPKQAKKAKASLDAAYMYLGTADISRDKKGRVVKEDSQTSHELQTAGYAQEGDYSPYVIYEFEMY